MNYLIGIKPKELKKMFKSETPNIKVGDKAVFWTGYKIKEDTIIWLRRLNNDGAVFAKAKIISEINNIKKDGEDKLECIIEIIESKILDTKFIYINHQITSNTNHGRLRDEKLSSKYTNNKKKLWKDQLSKI